MEKDTPVEPEGSETPVEPADDTVLPIGTESVGESADPVYEVGTDVVIGTGGRPDDTVYLVGTDPVGKSASSSDKAQRSDEGLEDES